MQCVAAGESVETRNGNNGPLSGKFRVSHRPATAPATAGKRVGWPAKVTAQPARPSEITAAQNPYFLARRRAGRAVKKAERLAIAYVLGSEGEPASSW